jgi:hypothetical protein
MFLVRTILTKSFASLKICIRSLKKELIRNGVFHFATRTKEAIGAAKAIALSGEHPLYSSYN